MPAQDLHSCSWFCEQPLCVLAQRDELRERMVDLGRDAARYRWAIASEDNAETLFTEVINQCPDADAIGAVIDAAMKA